MSFFTLKAKVRTAEFSPKYCFEAQQPIHRRVSVERGHLPHQICAGSLQNIQLFPFKFPSFPKMFQLPIEYRDWVCLHYFLWQCISHPKHSFFKIHILPYVTFAFLPITLLLCALVLELLSICPVSYMILKISVGVPHNHDDIVGQQLELLPYKARDTGSILTMYACLYTSHTPKLCRVLG